MSTSSTSAGGDTRVIVVGVSLTSGSPTALRWALAEASVRQAPLHAVTAWRPPIAPPGPAPRPSAFPPMLPAEIQTRTEAALAAAVRQAVGDDRSISCTALHGNAATVLLASASHAQLLVLGPMDESLTDALLHRHRFMEIIKRAPCPVVIMPSAGIGGR